MLFALHKANYGGQTHGIASNMPDFGRIMLRNGVSTESVGGANSRLYTQTDGEVMEPKSIGTIGKVWISWLRQVYAMSQIADASGSIFVTESGIVILESCYSDFASQRPTVAAVCGSLNEGWKKFVDLVSVSDDDFLLPKPSSDQCLDLAGQL